MTSLTLGSAGQGLIGSATGFNGAISGNLGSANAIINIPGQGLVLVVGSTAAGSLVGYLVNPDGSLGAAISLPVPGIVATSVSEAGYIYVAAADGTVGLFRPDAQGQLHAGGMITDAGDRYGVDSGRGQDRIIRNSVAAVS